MFLSENDIERALVRAWDHPTDRPAFAQMLMHPDIVMALMAAKGSIQPNGHKTATVASGSTLKIATVTHEGRTHLAFTASSRANQVVAPEKARDMFDRASDMSYLLNSDYGKTVTPSKDCVGNLLGLHLEEAIDDLRLDLCPLSLWAGAQMWIGVNHR